MKNTTLHTFLVAIAFAALLSGISATGIYAGSTDNKEGMALDQYHASRDVACADCHGENTQRQTVPMVKCLECHDTAELAEKTAGIKPTNPHKNRHYDTEADCNLCHHQHRKSENFCLPCHARFDFVVP